MIINKKGDFNELLPFDDEVCINLTFTYFETGKFENVRESKLFNKTTNAKYKTLLFDIRLDNIVPEEYHIDFEIP